MEAYSNDQEEGVYFSSERVDLSNRLKEISQDRLIEEVIALWDEVNNLELELIKNKRSQAERSRRFSIEQDRANIVDYEEKLRVANTKITRLENQLRNEKISRESFEVNMEKIKTLELEKANLLKNEEELMILIMDMERHIERLVDSVKEK
ncbi:MAG: hypothetical protein CMB08_07125 [Euryarchaeota archaeon]|nr:hypothetical protein [Euryarchaeota archaeon]MBD51660.1 hypothetical protein [Euryarchaeota archaeon]|tara:strand:- start:842 stop:1294 length:453 start_codon:yes stop_codon:yes gene_type:complete